MRLLVLWILLAASSASAQGTPYSQAIEQAVGAYNAGDFSAARARFTEAHALKPNARTWRGMGTCDFELAHWPEAVEELTQALDDPRSALSPELRERTEAQLAIARTRLPPPVVQAPPPVALPPVTSTEPLPRPRSGVLRGVAWASVVIGAAGFALATGYGVRSMHEGDTRDKYCKNGACDDLRGVDAGNDARRSGNIATAGWILGGVGLASAVALFWTDRAKRTDRPTAQLRLGPTSIVIGGTL